MLQHAVALLLQRLLGKFVTFDSSMLQLSLWQGDLSFQDLQLRLAYGEGEIGHLSVKIPWRALWTQPVQIKAQGIRVKLHQTNQEEQERQETPVPSADTSIDGSNGDGKAMDPGEVILFGAGGTDGAVACVQTARISRDSCRTSSPTCRSSCRTCKCATTATRVRWRRYGREIEGELRKVR
jgi:hypothetical protein